MSERGSGFGSFLLGLGIGAVLGFLFAPEPGDAARGKLQRKLRGLRDLAAEKAGELGQLLEPGDEEHEPSSREELEQRLTDAKRRRRGAKAPTRLEAPEEEDEPLA
ncbi:MAG TPA: YtxH domain-containing protein [Gemmatimonadales bacterium]|nr:YtxH domain-containing protein [Gemmatimonadales bacterium]